MSISASNADYIEFIPNRLYFYVVPNNEDAKASNALKSSLERTFICCDDTLIFSAFFADFGPLDLGKTVTFCRQLDELLRKPNSSPVVFYCSNHPHRRANAAVLICAYMIFMKNSSVEQAYGPFMGIDPPFAAFRDAAFAINTFPITVLDCCKAMYKVVELQHFKIIDFSIKHFIDMAKLQHGDISWIIPKKFIAFSGPLAKKRQLSEKGLFSLSPAEYVPLFKSLNVTCVVRFNSKCYDKAVFVNAGIRHVDLLYDDGANPPENILQAFLQLCEKEKGVIAVHCKAGLGRTGTNIAAYMIKHYGYTAKEAIAWCRICRPGSVVGPQQHYLVSVEARLNAEGDNYRRRETATSNLSSLLSTPSAVVSKYRTAPSSPTGSSKREFSITPPPISGGRREESSSPTSILRDVGADRSSRPSTSTSSRTNLYRELGPSTGSTPPPTGDNSVASLPSAHHHYEGYNSSSSIETSLSKINLSQPKASSQRQSSIRDTQAYNQKYSR